MSALILKGGRVIDPAAQRDEICDVLIENGVIRQVGKDLNADGAEVYDASGKIVTPGFIDMHTHFREPGQEAKEDFSSGSRAGAAGGYTTIATMPNTRPVVDDAALVTSLIKRAEDVAVIHIRIIGAVTKNQEGKELAELGDMVEAGAVAFSDDGHYDPSAKVLLSAYDYLVPFDKAIINHEEDTSLVEDGAMNEGHRSAMLGIKGRPIVAEDIAVARDIMLAEYAGAHVHVAHISSGRAVQLVREAKVRGVRATTEVTPHHLTLTDECVDPRDSSTKVNPPLRTARDVEAMVAGLLDGTIEMIVTDHSPHAPEEKDREYIYAPSGFPGLETALGILLTDLVHTGKVPLATLIERMTYGPARVFKLNAGTLGEGAPADVTVIDPELEWTVDVNKFYTRGRHSPFNGRQLKGKAVLTVVDGKIVMKDGVIVV